MIEHRPGRTITDVDNYWFTLLTMNTAPLHFDAHYSGQTEWGRPLVDSTLTFAIVTVLTRGVNQRGETVMSFKRTGLVYKRGHGPTYDL